VADLIENLIGIPGAVAVTRAGGEDAARAAPPAGEPAYLLYYTGTLDAAEVRNLGFEGDVAEPSAWGRLMNGGVSLTVEGRRAGVVYRDLDAVEHGVAEASEGRFEIDAVDGWLAGMPSYVLVGELATCDALAGELPRPGYPAALRESATRRWRDTAASVPRGDPPAPAGPGADVPVTTRSRVPRAGPADLEPDADGFALLCPGLARRVGPSTRPAVAWAVGASAGRPGRGMSLQVVRRSPRAA
jgi:hypothetical protein